MAIRHMRKLAILHKLETAYGTDVTPLAADALIASNVTFQPLEGQEVSRDLMLPYLGNQGVVLAGLYARLEFDVEIAGAGEAGTVPKYGSILRICGLSETVTVDTDVTYAIVEDDVESGSLYFVSDKVQHVMLGCRSNVSLTFTPKGSCGKLLCRPGEHRDAALPDRRRAYGDHRPEYVWYRSC